MFKKITREEKAVVLDYLPNGYPFDSTPSHRKNAIVQALGKEHFTLLELVPKKDSRQLQPGEDIYIGEGKREEIHHILGKLPLEKLTATAKAELEYSIEKLVTENEKRFVDFFNNSAPLSTRMHQLELLPGLGKKHMWEILEERKGKPFESFNDLKKRVKLLPEPKKIIIHRVMNELKGIEKHRIFVDV
ncbi:DNA-binding protein [Candidatus Woesearchaeota archaeon]|nr:DNA-binding protein [Candidatus Woesearchaeota archaeon]|tara:strand:- start:15626 stop:16192 length:567 start_codon:yes stop_codon:yes gene_type:complete